LKGERKLFCLRLQHSSPKCRSNWCRRVESWGGYVAIQGSGGARAGVVAILEMVASETSTEAGQGMEEGGRLEEKREIWVGNLALGSLEGHLGGKGGKVRVTVAAPPEVEGMMAVAMVAVTVVTAAVGTAAVVMVGALVGVRAAVGRAVEMEQDCQVEGVVVEKEAVLEVEMAVVKVVKKAVVQMAVMVIVEVEMAMLEVLEMEMSAGATGAVGAAGEKGTFPLVWNSPHI